MKKRLLLGLYIGGILLIIVSLIFDCPILGLIGCIMLFFNKLRALVLDIKELRNKE